MTDPATDPAAAAQDTAPRSAPGAAPGEGPEGTATPRGTTPSEGRTGVDVGVRGGVRPATPADVAAMDAMIHELAEYERSPELARATPEDLHRALFGPDPRVHAHVAEAPVPGGADGEVRVVGMAIWFVTYSTWTGRQGIWLEDLYVSPAARGTGLGGALLAALARECTDRGWTRFEWTVLDWNTPAQDIYRAVGAAPQDEWTTWRLDGEGLDALAARARR